MNPLRIAWLISIGSLAACTDAAPSTDVVMIVVDTLRADALGPDTPNILALANDGVRYEHAFTHAPMTLPAHTSLFSSQLPRDTGVMNNGQSVPRDLPLMSQWLSDHGYQTEAVVGLATMWPRAERTGLDRGFEFFTRDERELTPAPAINQSAFARLAQDDGPARFLFCHYADPHHPYSSHGTADVPVEVRLDGELIETLNAAELCYLDRTLEVGPGTHELSLSAQQEFKVNRCDARFELGSDAAIVFSTNETGPTTRVACSVINSANEPRPVQLSAWIHVDLSQEQVRERYRLEVRAVDAAIGELLGRLKTAGIYDQSLIVFTSDHGEALGEHGSIGHVRQLYDEVLRVPLIIKPPLNHPALTQLEAQTSGVVRHIDILPTMAELLGHETPPAIAGFSLLSDAERVVRAETHPPQAPATLFALRDAEFKLIYQPASDAFEMFDVRNDPDELLNCFTENADSRPDWVSELKASAANEQPDVDPTEQPELRALGYQ